MNAKLELFFDKYQISEKDRFDILQIYAFLSEERQLTFLQNLDAFGNRIKEIERDMKTEQDILISDSLDRIKNTILESRRKKVDREIKSKINLLKREL